MKYAPTCLLTILLTSPVVDAQDYRVEKLAEAAPSDAISEEISQLLAEDGLRLVRGEKRTVFELWLHKELPIKSDFEATPEVRYPLTPGQIVGVVRYRRRGSDFRDQDIDRGVYTLRYAHQPVDGAHVGTSLTRDFLLLLQAEHDQSPELVDYEKMTERSAEAAGTSHPCLLSMQDNSEHRDGLGVWHDDRHDWWIVNIPAKVADGQQPLAIQFVVVGVGEE